MAITADHAQDIRHRRALDKAAERCPRPDPCAACRADELRKEGLI